MNGWQLKQMFFYKVSCIHIWVVLKFKIGVFHAYDKSYWRLIDYTFKLKNCH